MDCFFIATVRDPGGNRWWQVIDGFQSELECQQDAEDFAKGILRPVGTPLTIEIHGPYDLTTNPVDVIVV